MSLFSFLDPYRQSATPAKKIRPQVRQPRRLPLPAYIAASVACLFSSGYASDHFSRGIPRGEVSGLAVSSAAALILLSVFFLIISVIKIRNPKQRHF